MGTPRAVRYFYGPRALTWPPEEGLPTAPYVLSFSRPPRDVIAAMHDTEITDFLAALPAIRPTWLAYEHEMDAKVRRGEYSVEEVKAAYIRVSGLIAAARKPGIRKTLILTGWDYANRMKLFWPGPTNVDVLAVDPYQWTTETVPSLFDPPLAVAASYGKPLGVAEFGVWSGTDTQRAAFVTQSMKYLRGRVVFATYFNADRSDVSGDHDWEIHDLPMSAAAWKRGTWA